MRQKQNAHLAMALAAGRHTGHMGKTVALILARQNIILQKMSERSPLEYINRTSRDLVRLIKKERSTNGAEVAQVEVPGRHMASTF